MILLIDNYDSFTYNLVHYISELGADVIVKRNDKITVEHKHTHTIDLFNTYKLLGKNMDNMTDADWKKVSKVMYKTFTSVNKIVEKAIKDIK